MAATPKLFIHHGIIMLKLVEQNFPKKTLSLISKCKELIVGYKNLNI